MGASRQRTAQIREGFSQSHELETQLRAVESPVLFDSSLSELRTGVLEEMPPSELKQKPMLLVLVRHTVRLLRIMYADHPDSKRK